MMKMCFYLTLIGCARSGPLLPSAADKLDNAVFVYPTGVQSERDLVVCPENSGCNIIHNRFWLPPIVERMCRCPHRRDCGWTWTAGPDNRTTTLDNRSQIKFCEEVQLPKCSAKKPALRVTEQSPSKDAEPVSARRLRNSPKVNRRTEHKNVTALCNCQEPHYWKLKANSTEYEEATDRVHRSYFCSKLKKCARFEFCGYVRTDNYSTFYRCSCPKGHLCITRDKSVFRVEEVLYSGGGYKAFCLPVKK